MYRENFYHHLWKECRQVFEPEKANWLVKLWFRLSNPFRPTPICLKCGRIMGSWRGAEPTCYKDDLV